MLTRSAVLIGHVVGLAALAATASATTLVGEGVSATRAGDRLTVAFTPAALAAAKLKPGARINVSCTLKRSDPPLALDSSSEDDEDQDVYGQGKVGADGRVPIDLSSNESNGLGTPLPAFDACEVDRLRQLSKRSSVSTPVARVGLTPAGVAWVDESSRGVALHELLVRAHGALGYAPAATVGAGVVALPSPEGSPPVGQTGYWTDGTRATAVSVSAAGRRLVAEDLGRGMLRTNVLEQLDPFGTLLTDLLEEGELEIGAGEKRPDEDPGPPPRLTDGRLNPSDGVRASRDGRRLVVRFTERSAKTIRALAGRRISVLCRRRPAPGLFPGPTIAKDDVGGSGQARVPTRGGRVAVTLSAAKGDLCLVADDGALIAFAAPGAAGRRWFHDLDALLRVLGADTEGLPAPGAQAYRTTADAVRRGDGLVALAGPDAPAPVGRVGVWTDGGRRAVIASRSGSGRTFLLADDGDGVVRTNVLGEMNELALGLILEGSAS